MPKFEMPASKSVDGIRFEKLSFPGRYVCTDQHNFGCAGRTRLYNEIFDDGAINHVVWQPDVYHEARGYFDRSNCTRVIDIGCGSSLKLRDLFSEVEGEVIAVDFSASLQAARKNFPDARHIECDLTSWNEVLEVASIMDDDIPTVVICADVIEHLPDPRPLLALIRLILAGSPASRAYISTPDRADLNYEDKASQPANKAHVREWTTAEFTHLMAASGFHLQHVGKIRANRFDKLKTTIFVECSFDPELYGAVLERLGLKSRKPPSAVMLTTEFPGLIVSGGIGTFVANWQMTTPGSAILASFPIDAKKSDIDMTSPWLLEDMDLFEHKTIPDVFLSALVQLLFYCPRISEVHYQDYLGIAFRIAQAKSVGVLPDTISTIVHCHGNQHYLENANGTWFAADADRYSVQEKISVELADYAVFPSRFLKNLYENTGIATRPEGARLIPYSYEEIASTQLDYKPVRRLVFVGKFSAMKGFDLFCEAFDGPFCKKLKALGVETLVFIGRGSFDPIAHEENIREHFALDIHTGFDHARLVEYIREQASDTVFVAPYRGDNFPLAVYDIVANGGVLIAGRAGGIPEMFNAPEWENCTFRLEREPLQAKIADAVCWNADQRSGLSSALVSSLRTSNAVNAAPSYPRRESLAGPLPSCTVMVPFYNTKTSEIIDLFQALCQQTLPPAEVIIVNDASSEFHREELESAAKEHLKLPYRIIDHPENLGLATARNTALAQCKTEIILNLDSDDVPLNDWVKSIAIAFARNPEAGAAVPYLKHFDDGTEHNLRKPGGCYRAIGDGLVYAQTRNELGHANSGYRVSVARSLGGWGGESKAKYEDWAFYLNLLSSGARIAIVPAVTCLYRIRKNSMVRTYSEWPGQMRLYRATGGLSRFEAIQLQRLSRNYQDSLSGLQVQKIKMDQEFTRFKNRKVVRLTDKAGSMLRRYPTVFNVAKTIVRRSWRLASYLRRG